MLTALPILIPVAHFDSSVWVCLRLWLYFLPSWVCKGLQEFMRCKFSHLRVHAEAPCGRPPTSNLLFLSMEAHTDIRIREDKLAAVSGHKTDEQDPLDPHRSRRMFSKLWRRTRTECRIVFSRFKNVKVGYTGLFPVAVSKRSVQTKTGKWKVVSVLISNPRMSFRSASVVSAGSVWEYNWTWHSKATNLTKPLPCLLQHKPSRCPPIFQLWFIDPEFLKESKRSWFFVGFFFCFEPFCKVLKLFFIYILWWKPFQMRRKQSEQSILWASLIAWRGKFLVHHKCQWLPGSDGASARRILC